MRLQNVFTSDEDRTTFGKLLDALRSLQIFSAEAFVFDNTVDALLDRIPPDIASRQSFELFRERVVQALAAPAHLGNELLAQEETRGVNAPSLRSGVTVIDNLLLSSLPSSVIEVSGLKGCGKTVSLHRDPTFTSCSRVSGCSYSFHR